MALNMYLITTSELDWVIAENTDQAIQLTAELYEMTVADYIRESDPVVDEITQNYTLTVLEEDDITYERTIREWVDYHGRPKWVCGTSY